jgi:hypothetical protein
LRLKMCGELYFFSIKATIIFEGHSTLSIAQAAPLPKRGHL